MLLRLHGAQELIPIATKAAMKRCARYGLSVLLTGMGLVHLRVALRAVFVFGSDEPVWSWVVILAGPGSTLLAAILSWWAPRVGGTWLVAGSVLSMLALLMIEGRVTPNFFQLVLWFAGPIAALGVGLYLIARRR